MAPPIIELHSDPQKDPQPDSAFNQISDPMSEEINEGMVDEYPINGKRKIVDDKEEEEEEELIHTIPISTHPIPAITEELNLELERIYLSSQSKYKNSKKKSASSNSTKIQRTVTPESKDRKPKKKVALLLSYCGTGYSGMQINPSVPSIELDLHKALAASVAVSLDNRMDPQKSSFVRCARTDKGVHAAGQVVSMKLIISDNVIEKINSFLPPQIRVWGYSVVNNAFHCKNACDSRIYEYLLPVYCLQPVDPKIYPFSRVNPNWQNHEQVPRFEKYNLEPHTAEQLEKAREYILPLEKLAHLREIMAGYIGTKNFHNFTIGKSFLDRSSKRYILSIVVSDPITLHSTNWISIKITGQSFMLHQIRKMVGLAIMMVRTETPANNLASTFTEQRLNIPKAPALGLLLQQPNFDQYNKDVGKKEGRDEIDFSLFKSQIDEFKERWIYDAMSRDEGRDGVYLEWVRGIDDCADDYGWYLREDGVDLKFKPPFLFERVGAHRSLIEDETLNDDV